MTPLQILPPHRFPRGVSTLSRPPEELFLWGQLPPPPWVAVVGTREPSLAGAQFARSLAQKLGSLGLCVASGGARGIDAEAHEGALQAGAPTVVVGPSGFDRPYPKEHGPLFTRIIECGGGYLSRVSGDVPAQRHTFFMRNRLLVACSAVVVLVEARYRSGARNAARWARTLGRPLLVVPHAPWHEQGSGCLAELRGGARLITDYKDVLSALQGENWPPFWGDSESPSPLRATEPEPLAAQQQLFTQLELGSPGRARLAVQAAMQRGARHPDEIQVLTGLSIERVHATLTELLLESRR
jgi:DNA processing protein